MGSCNGCVAVNRIPTLEERAEEARASVEARLQASRARRERLAGALSPTPRKVALLTAVIGCAVLIGAPVAAHADFFGDLFGGAVSTVADFIGSLIVDNLIKPILTSMVNLMVGILASMNLDGVLNPFENLLGGTNGLYSLVSRINETVVQPIAISIFGFMMLIQLINIAGKFDGNQAVPGLKEIFLFACYVFLFETLLLNSEGVFIGIYSLVNDIARDISSLGSASSPDMSAALGALSGIDGVDLDVGDAVVALVVMALTLLVELAAYVISMFMFVARAIEIYFMTMMSSVAFALLGNEHTRQMGIGFIKNYVCVCLSGAIMIFLLVAFPYVVAGIVTTDGMFDGGFGVNFAAAMGTVLAACLSLAFGLLHSGQWARNILGG